MFFRNKHKHLTDLEITPFYPWDWWNPKDWWRSFKNWRFKRKYGFDRFNLWDLDQYMTHTLLEHLIQFRKDAPKVIDMEYHKIEVDGEKLTLKEVLDLIIDLLIEGIYDFEQGWPSEKGYLQKAWQLYVDTLFYWWF